MQSDIIPEVTESTKGPFIATQLNSNWFELRRYKRAFSWLSDFWDNVTLSAYGHEVDVELSWVVSL